MSYSNQTVVVEAQSSSDKLNIENFVKTKLPALPGSVLRVSTLLRDVNVSTRAISDAVSYDPFLTARILRLANSPLYSLQRNVTSVHYAIEAIGIKAVYEIVMLGFASNSFANEIRNSVLGRVIWEHSLAVAIVARELSKMLGMRGTEETFICGLLHDIGKLMMLRADVEGFAKVLEKKDETEMLDWEKTLYGHNHAEVGAFVASRWGLPEDVCHTILSHHNPSQSDKAVMVGHIVSVADIVANVNGYGLRLEDESELLQSESAMMLHLTQEQIESAWINVQDDLDEVINSFN